MYVVGRERNYFEAWVFAFLVVLYGLYLVRRERRYLEARVFSSPGGVVCRVHIRDQLDHSRSGCARPSILRFPQGGGVAFP